MSLEKKSCKTNLSNKRFVKHFEQIHELQQFNGFQLTTHPAITCSNYMLTIETLEQGLKYVQSRDIDVIVVFLASLLLTLNIFHTYYANFLH